MKLYTLEFKKERKKRGKKRCRVLFLYICNAVVCMYYDDAVMVVVDEITVVSMGDDGSSHIDFSDSGMFEISPVVGSTRDTWHIRAECI